MLGFGVTPFVRSTYVLELPEPWDVTIDWATVKRRLRENVATSLPGTSGPREVGTKTQQVYNKRTNVTQERMRKKRRVTCTLARFSHEVMIDARQFLEQQERGANVQDAIQASQIQQKPDPESENMKEEIADGILYRDGVSFCIDCDAEMMYSAKTASSVCTSCGVTHNVQRDNLDTLQERRSFAERQVNPGFELTTEPGVYKRSNHFAMHLSCLQGTESQTVSTTHMKAITRHLMEENTTPGQLAQMDMKIALGYMRDTLQEMGLSSFYKFKVQILCRYSGRPRPLLTPLQAKTLRDDFDYLQAPFEQCKGLRHSFIPYGSVGLFLSKVNGLDWFARLWTPPKSEQRQIVALVIFKEITKMLVDSDPEKFAKFRVVQSWTEEDVVVTA